MTARFVSENLDLSHLPAPEAIKNISFEAILAERLARLKELWPDFDMAAIETDPAVILQQADAYREVLDKAAINDAVRAVMIVTATKGDLDNLAAFYGVERHVITPADSTTQTAAVMESDTDLRRRALLAPEALPYAGMTGGGYRSLALKTASSVKDVSTVKRGGGRVDVVLLGRTGNGTVPSETVNAVAAVFRDDEATQLTDVVSVLSATIVNYAVSVKLRIPIGPDPALVRATAKAAVEAYVASRHRVGLPVYLTGIIAAAQVGAVEQVVMISPTADVQPGATGAAYCTGVTVTSETVE